MCNCSYYLKFIGLRFFSIILAIGTFLLIFIIFISVILFKNHKHFCTFFRNIAKRCTDKTRYRLILMALQIDGFRVSDDCQGHILIKKNI